MVSFKNAAILTFVSLAYAAPLAHHHRDDFHGPFTGRLPGTQGYDADSDKTIVVIPTTTTDGDSSQVSVQPVVVATTPAAKPSNTSFKPNSNTNTNTGTNTNSGSSSGTGYMAVVNKMRSAGGLPALTQSSKLEANALKTANDGHGQMVHELNPGSFAQVLAPGNANNFESVYVGGWLCERPSLPGLNGICSSATQGWSHDGETGHADILSSTQYTNIGCALGGGIWACDLS